MSELEVENADLPNNLTIYKFAAARTREIQAMNKAISTTSAVKLAFQKLPKHMRRRAMSHNVKRLPRRLREIHLSQLSKCGLPPKLKRPSRKYRRRPFNLNSEYIRRKRRVSWLNTHIWHAKRFHMVEKWGYKLPYSPCDRAFRACFRATTKHCLLEDISYYICLEIIGESVCIIDSFKHITDTNTGLSISAKSYINGIREGKIVIFNPNNKKAVGTVFFNWKPNSTNDNIRSLWLWCHAAYFKEILDIIITLNNLKPSENPNVNDNNTFETYSNLSITLNILKWELSRFRLTGPLSTNILQNAFKFPESTHSTSDWLKNYQYIKQLPAIAEVSPSLILPSIILDPRYNFPKKRNKVFADDKISPSVVFDDTNVLLDNPIWDTNIRKIVTESKLSNAKLAELKRNLLVPGSASEEPVAVPILLIERPGKRNGMNRGYGSGWDIIHPSSWSQPIWLSLIMWGARSGGLRENESIQFESGYQQFLAPDTIVGEQEENEISSKMRETFFKLPPNKRPNFAKFKISSPFNWNWKLLLNEWRVNAENNDNFFVLRDKKMLNKLQDLLSTNSKTSQLDELLPEHCLIPIQIILSKRGSCRKFSLICLPQDNDYKCEPVEPNHEDPNEKERKALRKEHQILLKRLRRKRKRGKEKGKIIPIDVDMLKNYRNKMRKLWLPETTSIRHSCSREIMGFVKHGDFTFLVAKSKGIGYITSNSFLKLLSTGHRNKVLIRNTNSKQYRLGTINVIVD